MPEFFFNTDNSKAIHTVRFLGWSLHDNLLTYLQCHYISGLSEFTACCHSCMQYLTFSIHRFHPDEWTHITQSNFPRRSFTGENLEAVAEKQLVPHSHAAYSASVTYMSWYPWTFSQKTANSQVEFGVGLTEQQTQVSLASELSGLYWSAIPCTGFNQN